MTITLNPFNTQGLDFLNEKNAVHLDLSEGEYQFIYGTDSLNDTYFSNVYCNAIDVFEKLFSSTDEVEMIHLVINFNNKYTKTRLIEKYTNKYKSLPHRIESYKNCDGIKCFAFTYKVSIKNIKYRSLIKAICNQDFPQLKPIINQGLQYSEVYFVNKTKKVLYYLYDDRGLWLYFNDYNELEDFKARNNALVDYEIYNC
ncbi:hypothetical protein MTQ94_10045 [Staphylococcus agnetis]|uniref:DUF3885 domain-containing protein n=1 Tax=Staphylococcus agnetis TaxID=985762 RepID=UPI00208E62C0|nr:hypothetical protein [Staphylococcus agnetis]MCO4327713.1 hypothetical protein [Staphylococcus agnetis]MCO4339450.1 hypothetical protein [Staphylococcus agnetis]MCO4342044.1 hypothetical protein [Staphylococcus agnetis]MCO4344120.1 hypothetical protein [Staphylococcus agnetis]MCO4346433.1 hypothetical protein [Staphylococcus agnetis]